MNNQPSKSIGKIRRVLLNKESAIEIYKHKLSLIAPTSFKSCVEKSEIKVKGQSSKLAQKYGVSAKTIRDIWNKRSWASATCHLWRKEGPKAISDSKSFVSQHIFDRQISEICLEIFSIPQ